MLLVMMLDYLLVFEHLLWRLMIERRVGGCMQSVTLLDVCFMFYVFAIEIVVEVLQ